MSSKTKEQPHHGAVTVAKKPKSAVYKNSKPKNSKPSTSIKHQQPVHNANRLPSYGDLDKIISRKGSKWRGDRFVGAHVAKLFDGKWFYGTVNKYRCDKKTSDRLWQVIYDDGDQEEMDEDELNYWLMKYNVLYDKELQSNKVPYREWEQKPENSSKQQVYFKVSWTLSKTLEEFSSGAFDDCYGDEMRQNEEMYRENEMETPLTQMDGLFLSANEANSAANNLFRSLIEDNYDEDKELGIKCESLPSHCKKWSWSHIEYDEYDNSFLCEGHMKVEKVTKWCWIETE